jgi:hypothetical protein
MTAIKAPMFHCNEKASGVHKIDRYPSKQWLREKTLKRNAKGWTN